MRASPLGVICSKLDSRKNIFNTCALDTLCVHSDPIVISAVATYCYAISEAIKNPWNQESDTREKYCQDLFDKTEKFVREVVPENCYY